MLPHKTARGMEALKKLKCFDGCPHPYDKRKKFVLPNSLRHIALKPRRKYCTGFSISFHYFGYLVVLTYFYMWFEALLIWLLV